MANNRRKDAYEKVINMVRNNQDGKYTVKEILDKCAIAGELVNYLPNDVSAVLMLIPGFYDVQTESGIKAGARLIAEDFSDYNTNDKEVYAIDFDGVLHDGQYPNIGKPKTDIINKLKTLQKNGNHLILWTCRTGKDLERAKDWLQKQGLVFDGYNKDLEGNECEKLYADHYVDDKAMLPEEL